MEIDKEVTLNFMKSVGKEHHSQFSTNKDKTWKVKFWNGTFIGDFLIQMLRIMI